MDKMREIVTNPHRVYARNRAYWDFLLNSYEGGIDYSSSIITNSQSLDNEIGNLFINGVKQLNNDNKGNLFRHSKERSDDYNKRVEMSYLYNFCSPVIDIYTDHLFRQSVMVDFNNIADDAGEIIDDVDQQGSSLAEFRKNIAQKAQTYGHCFVITDSPQISGTQILTRADQLETRAFPYFTLYSPQCLINWSLDKFGRPYWVVVREDYGGNQDPMNFDPDDSGECNYRMWTRTDWYLFNKEYQLIDAGTHNLGIVPITCFYDKRSQKEKSFLGISAIADIAFIQRDIFNACSELRQILRDQTFSFLAVEGTADEYPATDLGTGKGLVYPEGRKVPQYVSPPGENADKYFQHIDRQVSKIFQLAKLEGGNKGSVEQTADPQSGVSKAWDFNQTNSALSSKSSNMEDGEISLWKQFALWQGKEFDGFVQYPNEFSVSSLEKDLSIAETEAKIALGKTYKAESLKAIVRKKFPRKTQEDLEKMDIEIDQLAARGDAGSSIRLNELIRNGGQSIRL